MAVTLSIILRAVRAPSSAAARAAASVLMVALALPPLGGAPAHAQSTADAAPDTSADATASAPSESDSLAASHPNAVPYQSRRSVGYHVLALPAYVLHGVTRPVGWTLLYLERNFPNLFEPKPRRRGVLPLVELGGPVGATLGVAFYDNHLLGTRQDLRLAGMVGARDFFEVEARYEAPRPLGPGTRFTVAGNFFSEPRDRFYLGGIDSREEADEARFSRRQVDLTTRLQVRPPGRRVSAAFDLLYEHVDASAGDERWDALPSGLPPALRPVDLLTPRLEVGFDATNGAPRVRSGTAFLLQLGYTHDLNSARFRYGRYMAAVHQYVPVPLFPPTRRLALRAQVEQVHPLFGGDAVPFFQRPRLGGQRSLRGYASERFWDDSALLFTAEYRYPVWSRMDAVFFVDTGQVFGAFDEVALADFKTTFGGGFHVLSSSGLSARVEVGRSVEGTRLIMTVKPTFGRSPR